MNKYPACQECKHADLDTCASCEPSERKPSDRIMKTIREEVQEALAAAKLAGYLQAQREELSHLDSIIERIRHIRKELEL